MENYKSEFNRLITLKRENESFSVVSYLILTHGGKNTLKVYVDMFREYLFNGCDITTCVYIDAVSAEFHVDGFSVILHLPDDLHDWNEDSMDVERALKLSDASMIEFEG